MRRWAAGALLLATAAAAQIRAPMPNVGPPLILRLEGVLQPTRAAAASVGFAVVSMRLAGADDDNAGLFLGVEDARTTGGDHPLDGKDVLAIVAPFDPNLIVVGPLALALRRLPPGTRVRMEGLVDRGSRTYYLRDLFKAAD